MTHQIYILQQLQTKSLSELKTIYAQIGASVEVADKRCKSLWVNAIVAHQSSQVKLANLIDISEVKAGDVIAALTDVNHEQAVEVLEVFADCLKVKMGEQVFKMSCPAGSMVILVKREEKAFDWSKFKMEPGNHRIVNASECGPRKVTISEFVEEVKDPNVEVKVDSPKTVRVASRREDDVTFTDIDGFYNFEARVNGEVIAEVSHDGFNDQQPWYVSVSGVEIFRSSLWCESTDWVKTQYVADALPKHQPQQIQVLTTREERAATIEVLEQHGDEFVVHNCENDHYYIVRPNHPESKERCECADCHYRSVKCKHQIAVENYLVQQRLEKLVAVTPSPEELLDKPFDELTREEWERLREYSVPTESVELVLDTAEVLLAA
ncbi:MAG: hypothetical protein RM021_030775 [Nostoc sp. EkiNYC01]|nr:hypothetical protein [Nostoc sp. EkiNYC01]